MKKILLTIPLFLAAQGYAATLLSDNFDSGSASADWHRRAGITVNAGGQGGSANYVAVNATTLESDGLGDVIGGASDFVIDFYFRLQNDSTNRQFNMSVSTTALTPNPPSATLNLRYQGGDSGTFALYAGNWQNINLGSVAAGQWYRMQVEGVGWGAAGASYTLRLSDAGGSTFTHVLSGLTLTQGGSISGPFTDGTPPVSYPGTAQSFIFSTIYGTNPGFDIDNVLVTGTVIPESSTALLTGAAAALLLRRRKR